jgi:Asp/Glu/hydantoin racemase
MVEPTRQLFTRHLPDVRLIHIVDDSLIQDVISAGEVTPVVKKRLWNYFNAAMDAGADVILNTCSSVGDVALEAKKVLEIPLVKIDDAMAEKAVAGSSSIGVLATLPTAISPTVRLIRHFAGKVDKRVQVTECLAPGAFQAIIAGDQETHDRLVLEAARVIADQVDLFVLAQGSMARLEDQIAATTGNKVLSSPESGVLKVKEVLASR